MSNVTFSLSMSLDGFVAGPHDEIDPLHDWLFSGEHPRPLNAWLKLRVGASKFRADNQGGRHLR
ncbi:hypothetical protein OM076_08825 [Solirubrobacter ginsenosidimutans]|uniref:Dihydrofolate reductase n=1 Tax=Solirubrobacter ginsenosidimutans TaxID=490573 RepID=A0A9X3S1R2_9ACTN|nr:hypothetical protein [Solirubrobacter ginsenosidimutans]MDA0160366.1 hypothetical protein [Solirubrobacter ginsenosidimutans]